MRILLALFLLFLAVTEAYSDPPYFSDDYKHVFNYALRDDKNVIIDFYTNWCGGCRLYDQHTFTDSTFKQYVLRNFYSAKINAELVQNKEVTKKYKIGAYPTIIIANPGGEEIERIVGYKGDDVIKFISLIEDCVKGKEKLKYLDSLYSVSPDSIELMRKIAIEKLYGVSDYKNLMRFSEKIIMKSHNPEIKKEAKFFYAIGAIEDKSNPNPQPVKNLLSSKAFYDSGYIEECNLSLLRYYENLEIADSIDHYFNELLKIQSPGGHLAYVRDYARFLYENNRKINIADQLTKEYISHPGNEADHWTPFLLAHSASKQNNVDRGIEIFDQWMGKYCPPDKEAKSIWPYEFYISFAVFYKISLNKALEYSRTLEKLNASKNNKVMVAKLLYMNNQKEKSIQKLTEVMSMIETQKEKDEIDELIDSYKN